MLVLIEVCPVVTLRHMGTHPTLQVQLTDVITGGFVDTFYVIDEIFTIECVRVPGDP
jgi:hypothetical protein